MKRRSPRSRSNAYLSLRTLIGNDVYNLETDELGDIRDILMDVHTGHIGYAVVRCRSEPTLPDDKLVAVPWRKLRLDQHLRCFLLDLSIERLQAAPALDASLCPTLAGRVWPQHSVAAMAGGPGF